MNWTTFHHPDVSLPVLRRKAGVEIMELLEMTALFMTRGGWGLINRHTYPNRAAFRNASKRLREKGLVVYASEGGKTPELKLSADGRKKIPDYFSPQRYWDRKWNGVWYVLVYDVPEADRKYRDVLRSFLKRLRMGCLQQSVWVTPEDIRPDFDDLSRTAEVDSFAYLLEARTVLGLSSMQLVADAWDFERLQSIQEHFCDICQENVRLLQRNTCRKEELSELIHYSLKAYHGAFRGDPLLPRALHPSGYLGREAFSLHKILMAEIEKAGSGVSLRTTAVS